MKWIVYILECSDTSLYTGITNDLERRLDRKSTGQAEAQSTRNTEAR